MGGADDDAGDALAQAVGQRQRRSKPGRAGAAGKTVEVARAPIFFVRASSISACTISRNAPTPPFR